LNNQSHGTHGTTIEAIQHVVESSTSKGIGFKKKYGPKQKKYRSLKSWVDELKQKRRKVNPSQLHSSQNLLESSTSVPLESYSVPSLSQPFQMSFTSMLIVCVFI